ncbi:sensor histidine kinase [Alteromonas facilis]|uniref:sensor histidine kinase n=1 Tax=Alteromonas facilis TaxID=2048004 RepID=UPI000C29083A|nr:HAMP domain-containing sensor histidine kinase [Alteromonas facilis]
MTKPTMQASRSLNATLLKTIVGFSALLATIMILLMLSYAWVIEDNVFNRLLASEADYIEAHYAQSLDIVEPRVPFMQLLSGWEQLPSDIQALHHASPTRIEFPLPDGGTMHLKPLQLGDEERLLVADVTQFEVSRDYLPWLVPWLLAVLLVVMAAAFMLSRYLARKMVMPIESIAAQIQQHQTGEAMALSHSLPNNEIGYLGETIELNINRLEQALGREADFTRDVSHELRTPTTVLKMIVRRINNQEPLDDRTIQELTRSVGQIEHTLDVLLALAREESMHLRTLCLLEEIEYCLVNHSHLMGVSDLTLDVNVGADFHLQANPNLLRILINNLISNALRHASAPNLSVELQGQALTFTNPVNQEPVEDVMSANVKGPDSEGIGQGLHMVQRICDHFGWHAATAFVDGKFKITINFAPAGTLSK